MNHQSYLCLLALWLGIGLAASAQDAPGIHLDGAIAGIVGPAGAAKSTQATSQGGEASPSGAASSASYTLFSGSHIPDEVGRILQYTLSAGWNLLGAPGTSDQSVGSIFVGAGGSTVKVGWIQYFDDQKLEYVQSTDSARILPRQGFFLFSYWGGESRTFTASPHIAIRDWLTEIPQGAWVLYSPPGKIILEDDSGLRVRAWDTTTQTFRALGAGDVIEPLHGYWIYYREAE